ncbi:MULTISPECIES: hypothetical protein [Mycolicibacterium]|nr:MULTISPECIES: hypothetical protein [Mycolicibacterium]
MHALARHESWAQRIGSATGYEMYPGEPGRFIVELVRAGCP